MFEQNNKSSDGEKVLSNPRDQEFIDQFMENLILYDPLDREFPMENEHEETINQATSTKDFRQRIIDLEKASSAKFNAPFTSAIQMKFQKLIDKEFKTINDLITHYIE